MLQDLTLEAVFPVAARRRGDGTGQGGWGGEESGVVPTDERGIGGLYFSGLETII